MLSFKQFQSKYNTYNQKRLGFQVARFKLEEYVMENKPAGVTCHSNIRKGRTAVIPWHTKIPMFPIQGHLLDCSRNAGVMDGRCGLWKEKEHVRALSGLSSDELRHLVNKVSKTSCCHLGSELGKNIYILLLQELTLFCF